MAEPDFPFLGSGWSFPPSFSPHGADLVVVSGPANVHKSIQILLGTEIGERIMRDDFGASLKRYQFELANERLLQNIRETITQSISTNEPRVILDGVDFISDRMAEGILLIQLQYTVRTTNARFNMVLPFYLDAAE